MKNIKKNCRKFRRFQIFSFLDNNCLFPKVLYSFTLNHLLSLGILLKQGGSSHQGTRAPTVILVFWDSRGNSKYVYYPFSKNDNQLSHFNHSIHNSLGPSGSSNVVWICKKKNSQYKRKNRRMLMIINYPSSLNIMIIKYDAHTFPWRFLP